MQEPLGKQSNPAGPGSSAQGRCAAGRLRAQALESGSSPSVAIYMCPGTRDTPHSTPLSPSCSEELIR